MSPTIIAPVPISSSSVPISLASAILLRQAIEEATPNATALGEVSGCLVVGGGF